MADAGGSDGGLMASARGLGHTALTLLRTRLSLLGVELQEEQARLVGVLLYGICAAIALGAGLVFLAVAITVALWENNRLLALGVFAALFLSAGSVCALVASRLARRGSVLFAASLAELQKDREALKPQTPSTP
jgi:uncharacterized membrane protein YqjE